MSNSATPWTVPCQASLSITNSRSLLKLMSIESVMPSNHLILCHPLLLPPSIFPSIRVFSNQSVCHIRWPKYRSFNFSISPSNEYSGLISWLISNYLDTCSVIAHSLSRVDSLQPHGLEPTRLLCPWDSRQEYWSKLSFPSPGNLPNLPNSRRASRLLEISYFPLHYNFHLSLTDLTNIH